MGSNWGNRSGKQLRQQIWEVTRATDLGSDWGNRSGKQLGQQIWEATGATEKQFEATGATDLGSNWGNRKTMGSNWGNEFAVPRPKAPWRYPSLKERVRTPNRYRAFRGKTPLFGFPLPISYAN